MLQGNSSAALVPAKAKSSRRIGIILCSDALFKRVVLAIFQHLFEVVIVVNYLVIHNFAILNHRGYVGIDKALVRLKVKSCKALLNLFVKLRVYMYCIFLHKFGSG